MLTCMYVQYTLGKIYIYVVIIFGEWRQITGGYGGYDAHTMCTQNTNFSSHFYFQEVIIHVLCSILEVEVVILWKSCVCILFQYTLYCIAQRYENTHIHVHTQFLFPMIIAQFFLHHIQNYCICKHAVNTNIKQSHRDIVGCFSIKYLLWK